MRTKKIFINTVIESLFYIIIAFVGLLKVKYMIQGLGSSLNGYYQFLNQIITYLFLAESGLSSAVLFKLYKPVANQDQEAISAIWNGAKKIFRSIGLIIIGLMIIALPFLYLYVKDSGKMVELLIGFCLLVFGQTLPFLTNSRCYTSLFSADQKRHYFAIIYNISRFMTDILTILAVLNSDSIYLIVFINFIMKVLEVIFIWILGKRTYPWLNRKVTPDMSAKGMSKDMVIHQIGSVVYNNIDSVLIMTFLGPVMVSIYNTYNYIVQFLKDFVDKNNVMITNVFGNVFAKENKERSYSLFCEYHSFFSFLALLFSLCFLVGGRSFIKIWINQDTYILSYAVIVFFAGEIFVNILVKPIHSIINANGLYKESKYYSLIESAVNLGLSILFLQFMGMSGVLIATCISGIVAITLRIRLVQNKVFDYQAVDIRNKSYFYIVLYTLIACLLLPCETLILNYTTNYFIWFSGMAVIGGILCFILGSSFYFFDPSGKAVFHKFSGYIKKVRGGRK